MADHDQDLSSKFYPLPCMFTLASLFCGFYSILASARNDFTLAATAIIIAGVFDGLDGRIARMTNTTSLFGKELDSLCDIVSFGVAPAVLAYYWALIPYGRYGWLAAFLYVATTSLRLARFNSQKTSSKHFTGLPCPAAAGTISASVLFCGYLGFSGEVSHISLLLLVYLLSYLMVSNHRYSSFKQPPKASRTRTFQLLVATVLLFVLIAAEPQVTLFALAMLYVPSGPLYGVYRFLRRRSAHAESEQAIDHPGPQ